MTHALFLLGHVLGVDAVLLNLLLGNFLPLLEELNVVFLGFLFDKLVVLVHLTHQSDMAVVHLFHVLFYFDNVFFGELERHQVGSAALGAVWRSHVVLIEHWRKAFVSRNLSYLVVWISVRVVMPLELVAVRAAIVIAERALFVPIVAI